jgi:hypothetical protein
VQEVEESEPADPLEALKSGWERVVGQAQRHSPSLAAYLGDVELLTLEAGVLMLKARTEYVREMMQDPARIRAAEASVEAATGRAVTIKIEEAAARVAAQESGRPDPAKVERLMEENAVLKKTAEMFDAEIVSIDEN